MIEGANHLLLHDRIDHFEFSEIVGLYKKRYTHKTVADQKADILLYGLIVAAIDNLPENVPISMHRLAEITFSELEEVQEHLPLILEVYPELGHYYVKEQTFIKN